MSHKRNFHRMGYLMLHHFAGATIQIANLVNYDCHLNEDDNNLRCTTRPQ